MDIQGEERATEPSGVARNTERPAPREAHAHASEQPFRYPLQREFVEPDWTRLPGYRDVSAEQWESAQWQRAHSVKNLKELKQAFGLHLGDELAGFIRFDGRLLVAVGQFALLAFER